MSFLNIFVGVPQSKYAALAILITVIVVSFTILFGKDSIPLTQKLAVVFLMFLFSLPGILLTLFQLTCIVTGSGFKDKRWWCWGYGWIVSVLLILYCVLLVITSVIALTNGEKMLQQVATESRELFEAKMSNANKKAVEYFESGKASNPVSAANSRSAEHRQDAAAPGQKKKNPMLAEDGEEEPAGFKVQGESSLPAPVKKPVPVSAPSDPTTPSVPEPFEGAAIEPFSTCGAPI